MKIVQKLPTLALGLALSALAAGSAQTARADSELCASLSTVSALQGDAQQQGVVQLKTEKLYRFQDRPWARMPLGVAITVRAPAGTTMADLHNMAVRCASKADEQSPLCVKGASINVSRNGGVYVLRVTSQNPVVATEIQKRAAK